MEILLNPYFLTILLGTAVLGATTGLTGVYMFLRKKALLGDALAHGVMPGVFLGFMLSGSKNPLILLAGALFSGLLASGFISLITSKTKLKQDTALAITLSFAFSIGIVLLTIIQGGDYAQQSGLESFIFGKAAAMSKNDVVVFSILGLAIMLVSILFNRAFKLYCFNPDFAKAIGYPIKFFQGLLVFLTVCAISVGLQAVGVILISALLVTPAAAARLWTQRFIPLLILSSILGAVSGVGGTIVSSLFPKMPTGPWIVMFLTFFAVFSILFSPKKGVLAQSRQRKKVHSKILIENVLKAFFHLGETEANFSAPRHIEELKERSKLQVKQLNWGLKQLIKRNLIKSEGKHFTLNENGVSESKRVVRLHRLWELYLTKRLSLPSDHVHPDAEAMEHVITPEVEKLLLAELDFPTTDPHNQKIPR